jgi:hypothetical protein
LREDEKRGGWGRLEDGVKVTEQRKEMYIGREDGSEVGFSFHGSVILSAIANVA